jgi:hypothetical protein
VANLIKPLTQPIAFPLVGRMSDNLGRPIADTGGGGGGAYVAKLVLFDHDDVTTNSCVRNDGDPGFPTSSKFTVSFVSKFSAAAMTHAPVAFSLNGANIIEFGFNASSDVGVYLFEDVELQAKQLIFGSDDGLITPDVEHHIFMSADTNHPAGEKIAFLYVDGVDVLNPANTIDSSDAFSMVFNITDDAGRVMCVPDDEFGGEISGRSGGDYQLWLGQAIDPTVGDNFSKFWANGAPVDPAIAAAAFGQQTVLLQGPAATLATNTGSTGTFMKIGTLTDV